MNDEELKAILILDMPKTCYECPLMSGDMYCKGFIPYTYENVVITKMCVEDYVMIGTRHSHCPLKPIPKMKDEVEEMNKEKEPLLMLALLDRAIGYNDCIDELLGETEE